MKKILLLLLFLLMLSLTSCPKEPMWYVLMIKNKNNQEGLKVFCNGYNAGDSLLPFNKDDFDSRLKTLTINGGALRFALVLVSENLRYVLV